MITIGAVEVQKVMLQASLPTHLEAGVAVPEVAAVVEPAPEPAPVEPVPPVAEPEVVAATEPVEPAAEPEIEEVFPELPPAPGDLDEAWFRSPSAEFVCDSSRPPVVARRLRAANHERLHGGVARDPWPVRPAKQAGPLDRRAPILGACAGCGWGH